MADVEQGTRGHVPGEPQAPRTEDSLAELELLGDRLSHLEGEVEAPQENAEHLGRQEARVHMHWRRKWQPTPVFLPGESQGRGSLLGCRLWGRTESNTTEVT